MSRGGNVRSACALGGHRAGAGWDAGAEGPQAVETTATAVPVASPETADEPIHRRATRYAWALLLARIDEVFSFGITRFAH
jgi:hypothetical protein